MARLRAHAVSSRLQQLLTQHDLHDWVWARLLTLLLPDDALRLAVAALESRDHAFKLFAQWLLQGDAPFVLLTTQGCLNEAARHGCWEATEILLRKLTRSAGAPLPSAAEADGPLERVVLAHKQTTHRFSVSVLEAAAARGDFVAVQWLLKDTTTNTTCVPTHRDESTTINLEAAALKAAADARHLDMVDWLVAYSEHIQCVVPYNKDLQCIAWSRVAKANADVIDHCCATRQYGFQQWRGLDDNKFVYVPHSSPLGDLFARDGDMAMLGKIDALSKADARKPRLVSPDATHHAVERGHLTVLQWLYERFPRDFDEAALETAAEHGHLHILRWAIAMGLPADEFSGCAEGAARHGHLHVLRWLQSLDLLIWDDGDLPYRHPMASAIEGGHVAVVQFLHEEVRMPFTGYIESALGRCPDLKTATYVLNKYTVQTRWRHQIVEMATAESTNVDMLQFYVLERGFWSNEALSCAYYRPDGRLNFYRFVYAHAQARAKTEATSLNGLLTLDRVTVLLCVQYGTFESAQWFAEAVPEVKIGSLTVDDRVKITTITQLAREPRVVAVLLACIRSRRDECLSLRWLPEWAIRANCYDAFAALVDMQHPHVTTLDAFQQVITRSRNSQFMLKLLITSGAECPPIVGHIMCWAAKIGSVAVLEAVVVHIPTDKRSKYLSYVNKHALDQSHVAVLEWCMLQSHADRASVAAQQGHVAVLEWLQERRLQPRTTLFAEALALDAASHNQLSCLQWILATLQLSRESVCTIERECVRRQLKSAARLLTRHLRNGYDCNA